MTDGVAYEQAQSLGVGRIVAQSFSILFRNLIPIMILGFVPVLLGYFAMLPIIEYYFESGSVKLSSSGAPRFFGVFAVYLVILVIYGAAFAAIAQLTYDAKLGHARSYRKYVSATFATLIPNVALLAVLFVLVVAGLALVVVPGLWVAAVFSVMIPALVNERAGFGAMRRSSALTKGYRWPIVGAILLIAICALLFSFAGMFLIGIIASAFGSSGLIGGLSNLYLLYLLFYGLSSVTTSLIYARLREIKEGVSADNLAAVFE